MTRTILLDLDDTLLSNDMDVFQAAYLKALAKHLSPSIRPDIMVRELLAGTQRMIQNLEPNLTLAHVFNAYFYPAIGIPVYELRPKIDQFYQDVFPTLQSLTSPKLEALAFVDQCLSKNFHLVIATNPLFPETAILQRVKWAGLDPKQFELITCYETFHFAKPNPAFYTEILERIRQPAKTACMIGNDLNADIVPARMAGLQTFWLTNEVNSESSIDPGKSGSFIDAWNWLEHTPNYC